MFDKHEQEIMKNWKDTDKIPKVSICCTTYNHEMYIGQALDSFLSQNTTFPFEVIVRDDCSTDNTADVIKIYQDRYPSIIKPIYEKSNGFSKGIRPLPATFKKAMGKYIAVCEGDDYWDDPTKLQIQVDFLDNNQEYVIAYHDMVPFNEEGEIVADLGGATRDLEAIELQQCTPLYTLTTCFRNVVREFPKEHYSSRLGDLFLWSVLGNYGKGKFLGSIKPARYRIHEGGIFSKKSKQERFEMALLTDTSLLAYYTRVGNGKMASYFKKKMIENWITSESTSKLLQVLFKFVGRKLKRKLQSKLKRLCLIK